MRVSGSGLGATTAEIAFLLRPDYAETILAERADSDLKQEFERIRQNFDAKPLSARCSRQHCGKSAFKVTARTGSPELIFWCRECYPGLRRGTASGGLTTIETFSDAMKHVDRTASGRQQAKRSIIRDLAKAKGFTGAIRQRSARTFFNMPVSNGPGRTG
jgi:hypothetical protein